jgi:hypothetical protein
MLTGVFASLVKKLKKKFYMKTISLYFYRLNYSNHKIFLLYLIFYLAFFIFYITFSSFEIYFLGLSVRKAQEDNLTFLFRDTVHDGKVICRLECALVRRGRVVLIVNRVISSFTWVKYYSEPPNRYIILRLFSSLCLGQIGNMLDTFYVKLSESIFLIGRELFTLVWRGKFSFFLF